MRMQHTLVSQLEPIPASDPRNEPNAASWPFMLDGIPVRREVFELGNELRRSFHGFRFHAVRGGRMDNVAKHVQDGGIGGTFNRFFTDVTVYIEGSDYVVGRIGYGSNYGLKQSDKLTYMIHSRKIQNEKFADHREQYNMSFVADQGKAVRIALSKLVPYSPKEMADITLNDFKDHIETVRNEVRNKFYGPISRLTDRNVLARELKNLIAQNAMFATEEFQHAATQFIQAEQDWEEIRHKPVHGYYVYVRMVGEEQWVDIVDATDAQKYRNVQHCPTQSMPATEVSDDIQGKIAVLSMANRGQYMQGVGLRTSDKSFWLERG